MFLRFVDCGFSRLLEENQEGNQGGGGSGAGEGQQQQQQPDLKALLADFQKAMIGELDKRVNGINKEFKQNSKAVTDSFAAFRTEIDQRLKPNGEGQQQQQQGGGEGGEGQQQQQNQQQQQGNNQGGNGQQSQQKPQKSPEMLALEREIATLKERDKQREQEVKLRAQEAERKEMDALTRTAIASHKFNSQQGPADLFDLVRQRVTRGEDGELYGPEGAKLDEYIQSEYQKRPFLHPAQQVNGSGATQSQGGTQRKPVDLNEITPDMTPEQLANVAAAINSYIPR